MSAKRCPECGAQSDTPCLSGVALKAKRLALAEKSVLDEVAAWAVVMAPWRRAGDAKLMNLCAALAKLREGK